MSLYLRAPSPIQRLRWYTLDVSEGFPTPETGPLPVADETAMFKHPPSPNGVFIESMTQESSRFDVMPLGGHIWNAYGDGLATMPLVGGGLLEDVIYQGISPLGEEGWDEEHQLYAFEILATEFAQTHPDPDAARTHALSAREFRQEREALRRPQRY